MFSRSRSRICSAIRSRTPPAPTKTNGADFISHDTGADLISIGTNHADFKPNATTVYLGVYGRAPGQTAFTVTILVEAYSGAQPKYGFKKRLRGRLENDRRRHEEQQEDSAGLLSEADRDDLVRDTVADVPVRTQGVRPEWKTREGVGRKEDTNGH